MRLRSIYHTSEGEKFFSIGRWIIGWTWVLGLFYGKGKALKYNYSHEELWIPEALGRFTLPSAVGTIKDKDEVGSRVVAGQCFSSTTRGDAEGVRFAPASDVLKHPERWKYIEFEVPDEHWKATKDWLELEVGKPYDFWGAAGFVLPVIKQTNKLWFCSEICDWIKYSLCIFSKRHQPISPRRSAMLMVPDWGEPKGL